MQNQNGPGPVTHYEGRRLPRPDDELQDQGLAFDVGTLLGRCRMLQVFGAGAATVTLAACGVDAPASGESTPAASSGLAEIPDETAGPYPGDGSNGPDVLEESGIVPGGAAAGRVRRRLCNRGLRAVHQEPVRGDTLLGQRVR